MKAIIKHKAAEGLQLVDKDLPQTGPNDVLIKLQKTAICGTDLHIYLWDEWAQRTIKSPMTIGHEFVGRVESIGNQVKDVQVGDLVSGEGHIVCGHCRNCLAGRRHLCSHTYGVGVNRDGAFAEYVSIPVSNVWHCNPNIPLEVLSCFDPLGNATHTALSFDLLGEDILITGAGPIGLMAVGIAKHAGARYVVATDPHPWRREMALKMGANLAINPLEESPKDALKQLGMQEGFDVGMEMSGNAQALNSMIDSMSHGGKISLLGIHANNTSIDWDKVVFNGLTIKGIYGREMYETWYKMSMMIETGLDITPIITHKLHYTEFEKGFDYMKKGECGKVVLDWTS